MAIDYTLQVATSLSVEEVRAFFRNTPGFIEERYPSRTVIFAPGVLSLGIDEESSIGGEIVREVVGIQSTIYAMFRLSKDTTEEGIKNALQSSLLFMQQNATAGVLTDEAGVVLVIFKEKRFVIDPSITFWTPQHLRLLTVPYERETFGELCA